MTNEGEMKILDAINRGWESPANQGKDWDSELVTAIYNEVIGALGNQDHLPTEARACFAALILKLDLGEEVEVPHADVLSIESPEFCIQVDPLKESWLVSKQYFKPEENGVILDGNGEYQEVFDGTSTGVE